MPLTVSQLMEKMPGAFIPEKAAGLDTVIQFKFTGAEAGDWYATIKDGKVVEDFGNSPLEWTAYKSGDKTLLARSDEFGFVNYEVIAIPQALVDLDKVKR